MSEVKLTVIESLMYSVFKDKEGYEFYRCEKHGLFVLLNENSGICHSCGKKCEPYPQKEVTNVTTNNLRTVYVRCVIFRFCLYTVIWSINRKLRSYF